MAGPKSSDRPPPLPPEPSEAHFVVAPRAPPGRVRRVLRALAAAFGALVVFLVAAAAGVVLHLDMPPVRRFGAHAVSRILQSTFQGRLTVTHVDALRLDRVEGVAATLETREGRPIASVDGVRARVALTPLLLSLLAHRALEIRVTELSVDHAEVRLENGADGQLTIASAFAPASMGPPAPRSASPGVALDFPRVTVARASVHEATLSHAIDGVVRDVRASFALPPHGDMGSMRAAIALTASVEGANLALDANLDRGRIDAAVDCPSIAPHAVDYLMGHPGPLRATASLRAEAHGTLSGLDVAMHSSAGTGAVDVHGHVALGESGVEDARVRVSGRDLDAAVVSGPASRISVDARAHVLRAASGELSGDYDLEVPTGLVSAIVTPSLRASGTLARGRLVGRAQLAQRGAEGNLRYSLELATKKVMMDLVARSSDLSALPQARGALGGSGVVRVRGALTLSTMALSASMSATLSDVAAGALAIGSAKVTAAAAGPARAPITDAVLEAHDLRLGGRAFPSLDVRARGSPRDLHVHAHLEGRDSASIDADAHLSAGPVIEAREVLVSVARGKDAVAARVRSVRSAGGKVDVEGIRLEGAGEALDAELHAAPGVLAIRAASRGLDVAKLARIALGRDAKPTGVIAIDTALKATKQETVGYADLDARDLGYAKYVAGVNAHLRAAFRGRKAKAVLDATDRDAGRLQLTTEGFALAGGALTPAAWAHATGHVRAKLDVDLARAAALTPAALPVGEVEGRVSVHVELGRDRTTDRPDVTADVSTRKVCFTTGGPFHYRDLDADARMSVAGETGAARIDVDLHDSTGPLLSLRGSTTLPLGVLLRGEASEDDLLSAPLELHVDVPRRSLATLPPLLGPVPLRGAVSLSLDVEGQALAPNVAMELEGDGVEDADDPAPTPIGVDAKVDYDGTTGHLHVLATRPGVTVLDARGQASLGLRDLLVARGPPRWDAGLDATFHDFPLGAVADLGGRDIAGNLSGTVALHDLHRDGKLDVKLDVDHVVLSRTAFPHAKVELHARDGATTALARIDEAGGFAQVDASGALRWGDALAPSPDPSKPARVHLAAKRFRLIAIAPLLESAVSELDGVLDADATLSVAPGFRDGSMDGAIVLEDGIFDAQAIGEELHDVRARVFMKPWGVWNVQQLSGRGPYGRFTATAKAKVEGLRVQTAEAHVTIARKDRVPLAIQGSSLGTVWGGVDAKAAMTPDGKTLNVQVDVPHLHVDLEDATTHAVQSTDPDPTIAVGAYDSRGRLQPLPTSAEAARRPSSSESERHAAPPLALHVVTKLGPDLEVTRGTMLELFLEHGPTIDVGSTTKISGSIEVEHGWVELQGKRFDVARSEVRFTGQPPDDPIVNAHAVYDAPDGTKVLADFVGPAKTGKVTLRSEPPLSQNEILALLLFGTADGTFGQAAPPGQQGNEATQAASLAGGVMTEGINKAISGVTPVEVQTRVDTQEAGNPRPEVEVALSRTVRATVVYNLGVPPPGQNPDDTLLLIDWRFHKNYSALATLGDKGTTIVDLAWRHRY